MAAKKCMEVCMLLGNNANVKQVNNLDASGIDVVLTTTLYAIIGAIALQKGGDVAAAVANEKILKPLGIL